MKKDILVSIACTTYNHSNFLKECLDSFLMQQTDFNFEVVIHDDASTDGSREIIEQYACKYPEVIFPMFQSENQYSKGVRGMMTRFNFPRCRGKYIALCEGDDYWTDPLKLQKQVDFLEQSPDFSLCFHNAFLLNQETGEKTKFRLLEEREYSGAQILEDWMIPTASVLFRKSGLDFSRSLNPNYVYGDIILFLTLAESGKIWGMKDCMSVYRIHSGGVTSMEMTIGKLESLIKHHKEIEKDFSGKYKTIQKRVVSNCLMYLSLLKLKQGKPSAFISIFDSYRYEPSSLLNNIKSVYINRIIHLIRKKSHS